MKRVLSLMAIIGVMCVQGMAAQTFPAAAANKSPGKSQGPSTKPPKSSKNASPKENKNSNEDGAAASKRAREANQYGEFRTYF